MLSPRMLRIPSMTSTTGRHLRLGLGVLGAGVPGSGTRPGIAPAATPGSRCQISSVMKGMKGCSSRSSRSSTCTSTARVASFAVRVRAGEHRLRQLDVPVAELAPGELVERRGGVGELVRVERGARPRAVTRSSRERIHRSARVSRRAAGGRPSGSEVAEVEQQEARGVPQLVGEGLVAVDPLEREPDVPPLGGEGGERETQRVGPEGGHALGELVAAAQAGRSAAFAPWMTSSGSMTLPFTLRHLLAVLVAHHAVEVDVAEGHLAHEVDAQHHHPGDPEEEDVVPGLEHRGRVERLRARGVVRPAQRARTARAPELNQVSSTSGSCASWLPAPGQCGGRLRATIGVAAADRPARRAPQASQYQAGNPVAPPQLAADAPVADVLHPVEVGAWSTSSGMMRGLALAHGVERRPGQRLHLHEPLRSRASARRPCRSAGSGRWQAVCGLLRRRGALLLEIRQHPACAPRSDRARRRARPRRSSAPSSRSGR